MYGTVQYHTVLQGQPRKIRNARNLRSTCSGGQVASASSCDGHQVGSSTLIMWESGSQKQYIHPLLPQRPEYNRIAQKMP